MSTAAVQSIPGQSAPVDNTLLAIVAGKIQSKRRISTQNGPLHLTVVRTPAKDEFETPGTVELRSDEALGEVGSSVRLKVRVGGRARRYIAGADTPDAHQVNTAENTLTVVL